jgi:hypothetical protein
VEVGVSWQEIMKAFLEESSTTPGMSRILLETDATKLKRALTMMDWD